MFNIFKETAKSQSKNYLPEVDGLRAVAVILVLIFHLNPTGYYKGGFIGVDIFFVISGFLITGIIYNQMRANKFNYFRFMEQRIARLYPALLVTILFILVVGFFCYISPNYNIAGGTTKYVLLSISNFLFAKQSGYWDISSINNPFLHTWSLSVEQQFYLIWPFIIIFGLLLFKRIYSLLTFVFIVCITSLISAQYLSAHYPIINFYTPSSRIFELGVGGLWAIFYIQNKDKLNNIHNSYKEILFAVGVTTILILAHRYKENMSSFPGYNTIYIALASILCIFAGQARYLGWITRNKLCVGLGIISYSVYLIHWPLIVFYKVLNQNNDISILGQIAIFVLSLTIGFLMYVLIENRYRKISISPFSKSGKIFIASFLVLLVVSLVISYTKGFPWRIKNFSQDFIEQSSYTVTPNDVEGMLEKNGIIILGDKTQKPKAIFIGDSYLHQYFSDIDAFFNDKKMAIYYSFEHGCIFLNNITHDLPIKSKNCLKKTNQVYELINQHNLPIIRINNWPTYLDNNTIFHAKNSYMLPQHTVIQEIKRQQLISKHKVLLIISQPAFIADFNMDGLPPFYLKNQNDLTASQVEKIKLNILESNSINQNFVTSLNSDNFMHIDIFRFFCSQSGNCMYKDRDKGYLYFSYNGHLSKYGAHIVWTKISNQVYRFILDNQ